MPLPDIALIGLMGSGKTTVGLALAARLGRSFVDTDAWIEAQTNCMVSALFAERGEPFFRDLEETALSTVCGVGGQVIATGGGAVLRPSNQAVLRNHCVVVWLTARPDVAEARVSAEAGSRPLLQSDSDLRTRLLTLLGERSPLYQETAHLIVDTSDRSPDALAAEIQRKVERLVGVSAKEGA